MIQLLHDANGDRLPEAGMLTALARNGTYVEMLRYCNAPAYRVGLCAFVSPILLTTKAESLWLMESRDDVREMLARANSVIRWVHIPTALDLVNITYEALSQDSPVHLKLEPTDG